MADTKATVSPPESAEIDCGNRETIINEKNYTLRSVEILGAVSERGHWIPVDAYANATLAGTRNERRLHVGLLQPDALDAADRIICMVNGWGKKDKRKSKSDGKRKSKGKKGGRK